MRRSIAQLLMLALVCLTLPVQAQTPVGSEAATGTNIFSTPDDGDTVPTFDKTRGAGPGAKLRQALLGNTRDDIPDFKQIQMLPTLTLAQRQQLREMNKGNKLKVQQLVDQLKKLKAARDTADGGAQNMAGLREQFESVRTQLQAIRKQSWEQSKTLLTDSQIRDIQAMKRGELQPSTFRNGNPAGEMMTHQ